MAYEITCAANAKNTGINDLCQDIGAIVGFMVCPWDYKITNEAAAKLEATYIAAIHANKAERVYPFPTVFAHEDGSEEAVYQDGAIGSIFVRDGKMVWTFTFESSRYKHQALKSHSNKKVSVLFIDQQGRIQGVKNEADELLAINMQRFTVEKLMVNNGTEGTTTKVSMQLDDALQFQMQPAVVIPSFSAKNLEGLKDVKLTLVSSTASLVVVRAAILQSGNAVLGLSEVVGEDWAIKNAGGATQTPTTITDNSDGTYNFAFGTPLVAGTYSGNLLTPAEMVTKGYESTGATTTFTIA